MLIVIGVALWGDMIAGVQYPYIATLDITSAALAIIAAVFLIMVVAGASGGNRTGQ